MNLLSQELVDIPQDRELKGYTSLGVCMYQS